MKLYKLIFFIKVHTNKKYIYIKRYVFQKLKKEMFTISFFSFSSLFFFFNLKKYILFIFIYYNYFIYKITEIKE